MSNVIDFLENVGRDATLRYAAADAIANALDEASIAPPARAAILNGMKSRELETALGAKPNICCGIMPVE